jgi:hypothetical protein
MKRLLLVLILVLSSESVYAEWTSAAKDPDGRYIRYADVDTVQRKGELVKYWELKDYNTAQTVQTESGELKFLSAKMLREYNCAEGAHHVLEILLFTDNMGKGALVFRHLKPTEWIPNKDTLDRILWKLVCSR